MVDVVTWPDHVQKVFAGDLVTALAYTTPAGGAVAIPVSPTGSVDRTAGSIGLTTSLAFSRKLRQIVRDPRVAMAYHTREHGFADTPEYVLAQGTATVPLQPDLDRLVGMSDRAARFVGPPPTGRFWRWVLREYLAERVVVDIAVRRVASWPGTDGTGDRSVYGDDWPAAAPAPQVPPAKGTGPRLDTGKLFRAMGSLPHQVVAYRGSDGYPVIVPVRVTGHDDGGLALHATAGLLPPGGRRAGLLGHAFGPQVIGLANRTCTGWLEVSGDMAVYGPHTATGFRTPPNKSVQLFANGMAAKYGVRAARRDGTLDELARLQADRAVTKPS